MKPERIYKVHSQHAYKFIWKKSGLVSDNIRPGVYCSAYGASGKKGYKLNTKYEYITISQNTTKIIVLCCTICFTTTCFGPFL